MLFLGHNFWTRNARKLIKGLKDSDYSLVSNKNLNKKIPPSNCRSGPRDLSQNGLKPTPYVTQKKSEIHNFPVFLMQSRKFVES